MKEGPPDVPQEKKEVLIGDEECISAMREGQFGRVAEWYAQQEKHVDADPTPHGRLQLTVRLARLQFESGIVDEDTGELYAFATLAAAREDAFQRRDDRAVEQIETILNDMRGEET